MYKNTAFIITNKELNGRKSSFTHKNEALFHNNLLKSFIFIIQALFRFHF